MLVRNAIQTPDGTILESINRHDYVTHVDTVTGEEYMVDGGLDYCRRNITKVPAIELSVYITDGIEAVREAAKWGTYGKDGKQPLRYVPLCEMTDQHIEMCLKTQSRMRESYRQAFQMELEYRKQNNIQIVD